MNLLVCGSRDFSSRERAFGILDQVHKEKKVELVIEGGTRGGDRLGREWAQSRNIPVRTVNAEWEVHGRSAGFIRNKQMVKMLRPGIDCCVALWDGRSRGTAITMDLCRQSGVQVLVQS